MYLQLVMPTGSSLRIILLCNYDHRAAAWGYLTTITVSLLYMMSQVDTLTVNYITMHTPIIQLQLNNLFYMT